MGVEGWDGGVEGGHPVPSGSVSVSPHDGANMKKTCRETNRGLTVGGGRGGQSSCKHIKH